MQTLSIRRKARTKLPGQGQQAIVGVVASGNLEILAQRTDDTEHCIFILRTAVTGYDEIWRAVIVDFVERSSPGGTRFDIHDGGARPDTVMLRLMQAARALEIAS